MKRLSSIVLCAAALLFSLSVMAGEPMPAPSSQPAAQPQPAPVVQPATPAPAQPASPAKPAAKAKPAPAVQPAAVAPVAVQPVAPPKPLVITTLTDYSWLVRRLGGDHVRVESLVPATQNPAAVTAKPWFAQKLTDAVLLVATDKKAEPWLIPVIRRAGCKRFYPGKQGLVYIADGIRGKIAGNHAYLTSPVNARQAAKNIAAGLVRVDNANGAAYQVNLAAFLKELDTRMYGAQLVDLIGGDNLAKLAGAGELMGFLQNHRFNNVQLIDLLDGWMKRFMPFRGTQVVTHAASWGYFARVFGIDVVATLEPFPGMLPTAAHNGKVLRHMQQRGIKYLLTESWFSPCEELDINALPLVAVLKVPVQVGGEQGLDDYFALVERWFWAFENAKPASLLKVQPEPLKPAVKPGPVAPPKPAPVVQPVQKPVQPAPQPVPAQ